MSENLPPPPNETAPRSDRELEDALGRLSDTHRTVAKLVTPLPHDPAFSTPEGKYPVTAPVDGVFSRRALTSRLSALVASGRKIIAVSYDACGTERANRAVLTSKAQGGDYLIRTIAKATQDALAEPGGQVLGEGYCIGGDEFVILFNEQGQIDPRLPIRVFTDMKDMLATYRTLEGSVQGLALKGIREKIRNISVRPQISIAHDHESVVTPQGEAARQLMLALLHRGILPTKEDLEMRAEILNDIVTEMSYYDDSQPTHELRRDLLLEHADRFHLEAALKDAIQASDWAVIDEVWDILADKGTNDLTLTEADLKTMISEDGLSDVYASDLNSLRQYNKTHHVGGYPTTSYAVADGIRSLHALQIMHDLQPYRKHLIYAHHGGTFYIGVKKDASLSEEDRRRIGQYAQRAEVTSHDGACEAPLASAHVALQQDKAKTGEDTLKLVQSKLLNILVGTRFDDIDPQAQSSITHIPQKDFLLRNLNTQASKLLGRPVKLVDNS